MFTTKQVLERHLGAFVEGNLELTLEDYEPSASLFTPNGTLTGTEAIRALYVELFAEFGKPEMSFNMQTQSIKGECAYIVWSAETQDNIYEWGTDTFVVRNGKIVAQTFAAKIVAKK